MGIPFLQKLAKPTSRVLSSHKSSILQLGTSSMAAGIEMCLELRHLRCVGAEGTNQQGSASTDILHHPCWGQWCS